MRYLHDVCVRRNAALDERRHVRILVVPLIGQSVSGGLQRHRSRIPGLGNRCVLGLGGDGQRRFVLIDRRHGNRLGRHSKGRGACSGFCEGHSAVCSPLVKNLAGGRLICCDRHCLAAGKAASTRAAVNSYLIGTLLPLGVECQILGELYTGLVGIGGAAAVSCSVPAGEGVTGERKGVGRQSFRCAVGEALGAHGACGVFTVFLEGDLIGICLPLCVKRQILCQGDAGLVGVGIIPIIGPVFESVPRAGESIGRQGLGCVGAENRCRHGTLAAVGIEGDGDVIMKGCVVQGLVVPRTVHIPPLVLRAIEIDVSQTAAAIKRILADPVHAAGYGHAGQTAAALESIAPDTGHAAGYGHAGQTAAALESIVSDAGDAVLDHNGGHGLAIPWRHRHFIVIRHGTGAGDRQDPLIAESPGQILSAGLAAAVAIGYEALGVELGII